MFLAFKPETGRTGGEATAMFYILPNLKYLNSKGELRLDIFVP